MSKERDIYGVSDALKVAAIAFLGILSAFYPENTKPGQWVSEKKQILRKK